MRLVSRPRGLPHRVYRHQGAPKSPARSRGRRARRGQPPDFARRPDSRQLARRAAAGRAGAQRRGHLGRLHGRNGDGYGQDLRVLANHVRAQAPLRLQQVRHRRALGRHQRGRIQDLADDRRALFVAVRGRAVPLLLVRLEQAGRRAQLCHQLVDAGDDRHRGRDQQARSGRNLSERPRADWRRCGHRLDPWHSANRHCR